MNTTTPAYYHDHFILGVIPDWVIWTLLPVTAIIILSVVLCCTVPRLKAFVFPYRDRISFQPLMVRTQSNIDRGRYSYHTLVAVPIVMPPLPETPITIPETMPPLPPLPGEFN